MIALHASLTSDVPGSAFAGEAHACLGVDIQAVASAVGQEVIRLDYGADDGAALRLGLALRALGEFLPLVERPGQLLRVRHDLEDARVVVTLVPAEPESADFHSNFSVGVSQHDGEASGRASQGLGRDGAAHPLASRQVFSRPTGVPEARS